MATEAVTAPLVVGPLPAGPLMLDLKGLQLSSEEALLLRRAPVGGVILFARNYHSPAQLLELTGAIRDVRPELIVAVDQEGGRVQRFKQGFTRIPPMAELGRRYLQEPDAAVKIAENCGWLLASELIAYGVDISFTPVLDLGREISQVIGDRAFSADYLTVIALARALMAGMHEAGMATTAKHFPGHGGVEADSHLDIPVDQRSYETINKDDLQPFSQLVDGSIDAVMPAHVIFEDCDSQPAGFSHFWLQDVLRHRLQFNGVIFSDDLSMKGASVAGGYAQRAAQALEAGCDMVLVCNQPEKALEVVEWMEAESVPSKAKLALMKARKKVEIAALSNSSRWQHTRDQVEALAAKTGLQIDGIG